MMSKNLIEEKFSINLDNIPSDAKLCMNCSHFEDRTHFCRANPPKIVVFSDSVEFKVSSKFPVISKPYLDWCDSNFSLRNKKE